MTDIDFDFDVRRCMRRARKGEAGVPARLIQIIYEPTPERDRRLWYAIGILLTGQPMEGPGQDHQE